VKTIAHDFFFNVESRRKEECGEVWFTVSKKFRQFGPFLETGRSGRFGIDQTTTFLPFRDRQKIGIGADLFSLSALIADYD
jgi:hypothetical protein